MGGPYGFWWRGPSLVERKMTTVDCIRNRLVTLETDQDAFWMRQLGVDCGLTWEASSWTPQPPWCFVQSIADRGIGVRRVTPAWWLWTDSIPHTGTGFQRLKLPSAILQSFIKLTASSEFVTGSKFSPDMDVTNLSCKRKDKSYEENNGLQMCASKIVFHVRD